MLVPATSEHCFDWDNFDNHHLHKDDGDGDAGDDEDGVDHLIGVGDVCFFLTMRCFNDAMFSNS